MSGVLWTLQGHYMLGLALLQKEDYAEGVRQLEKVITSHKYYLIKNRKRGKKGTTYLNLHDSNLSLSLNRKKHPFLLTKKKSY